MAGYDHVTLKRAQNLRREMTDTERILWAQLRGGRIEGYKFRRQQPIGPYIVDFVCQGARLVVEVDGSQHADSEHDARRDAFLDAKGYRVLRFWNNDVSSNMSGVIDTISLALDPSPTSTRPLRSQVCVSSPSRGEEGEIHV